MSKRDTYRTVLESLDEWESFLLGESGLPGKRANLELVQVVADMGNRALFEAYLTNGPETAPTNSPQEFLALCGIVGLGRLVAEGQSDLLAAIKHHANDPRWRMHEGVRMALQRLGEKDMERLIDEVEGWVEGSCLERRAAAAALCDPGLLRDKEHARRTLAILDAITASVHEADERSSDGFMALRKGLGYCWSVAVAALPDAGKPLMEKWIQSGDRDVLWIMKQNLGKKRLERMDAEWVEAWRGRLGA